MKKILKLINVFISIILIFVAVGVAYIAFPQFGNKALIVRSGSMNPTIDVGSVVVARPAQNSTYKKEDIIAFRSEKNSDTIITHRVIGVEPLKNGIVYKTKGDANEEADGWSVSGKNVLGKVQFTIPYVGQILTFAKSRLGFLSLIVIPALFVIFLEFISILKELRRNRKKLVDNETFGFVISGFAKKGRFGKLGFKVLLSGAAFALLAIPGTYAYLQDQEESVGNIFQAASEFPTPQVNLLQNLNESPSPSVSPTPSPEPSPLPSESPTPTPTLTIEPSISPEPTP